jgi:hypothetical protein
MSISLRPALSLILGLSAAASAAEPAIRVVDCDAPVQSHKRGICANKLGDADFTALAPGVSWWYNWYFEPSSKPPAGVHIDFLPMAWGDNPKYLAGLEKYLSEGNKPKHILAINEPNLKGQAFITPEETAKLYARIKTVADAHSIDVVGPNMSLGSAAKDSITAQDPIDNKPVTYTFMNPFLKAFLHYAEPTPVGALGVHSYGNIAELRWLTGMMAKEFKRPIWVTEFAQWKTANAAAAREYLVQATDLLEASPDVQGYAWFKERSDNKSISLFEAEPGKLSELGKAYVAMPVHDADLYYRIPGTLQAERYTTAHGAEVHVTTDTEGFLQLASTGKDTLVTYQIQVDKAGSYAVELRLSGVKAGAVTLQAGTHAPVTVAADQPGWQSLTTQLTLAAGPQRVTVAYPAKGLALNWLRFSSK